MNAAAAAAAAAAALRDGCTLVDIFSDETLVRAKRQIGMVLDLYKSPISCKRCGTECAKTLLNMCCTGCSRTAVLSFETLAVAKQTPCTSEGCRFRYNTFGPCVAAVRSVGHPKGVVNVLTGAAGKRDLVLSFSCVAATIAPAIAARNRVLSGGGRRAVHPTSGCSAECAGFEISIGGEDPDPTNACVLRRVGDVKCECVLAAVRLLAVSPPALYKRARLAPTPAAAPAPAEDALVSAARSAARALTDALAALLEDTIMRAAGAAPPAPPPL
jgi:hypothetical protein